MTGSTLRTATVAVSHRINRSLAAARAGFQRLERNRGASTTHQVSTSSAVYSAAHADAKSLQVGDLQGADTGPKSGNRQGAARRLAARRLLNKVTFVDIMRLIAPEAYVGDSREAKTLDEALAGFSVSKDLPSVIANASRKQLHLLLVQYLASQRIDIATFLGFRNAMLANSWPDARRHMIGVVDGQWPSFVLCRAIHTVSTPSEISDALALVALSIRLTRNAEADSQSSPYRAFRYCLATLSRTTVKESGAALHLMPRLTEAIVQLVDRFPSQATSKLILDFVKRCTLVPDERTRQAVMQVLNRLENPDDAERFEHVRRRVVGQCIANIERSMAISSDRTAASEHFVSIEMMDRLLRFDYGTDADLQRRALRASVHVAGRGRDYHRTLECFNTYERFKKEHGLAITGDDLQQLAKSLARSKQGRKDAWHILVQAERLWQREAQAIGLVERPTSQRKRDRLAGTCLDLLEVMSASPDVRVGTVFSMLGIFTEDGTYLDGKASLTGEGFSAAMLHLRGDMYAYSVVMRGMLLRKRPRCALTIWQAMLQRGVLPNVATLSVLLQNLFHLKDVKTAMQQLQLWCEQGVDTTAIPRDRLKELEVPTFSPPAMEEIRTLWSDPTSTPSSGKVQRYRVVPDTILATVVFEGLHRCGAGGIDALWEAYQKTIDLFPDAPVLAVLLKASCHDESEGTVNARFGQRVFRTILFSKHPELIDYQNPLRAQLEEHGRAGWILSDEMGKRMEKWVFSMFESKQNESALTVPTGNLSGLSFTSKVFEHYLRLLLHLQHSPGSGSDTRSTQRELVDLLGWMKELSITPSVTHIALSMLEIEEHLPPPVAARQMDLLESWLIDWLGEDGMPQQDVMQRHWQWKMQRNDSRKGWFDRVVIPKAQAGEEAK